ncbi:DUF4856 domain-containing protein [Riemerella columbipharyngis]|uniref:DUF4856 domain-containing protein n=1 Tax=Riemerella columbipharyngis TaxID=1071918 RepID=A0A1G6Y8H8_9FLAO|nr:DUF4856 domain-containing protein [Riemerella columbipharyngis]SDD86729.1 protein of unknown function [Riemerella columbipharyngis]
MKNKIILALMLSSLSFISCSRGDGGSSSEPITPITVDESYKYEFSRNGFSTVDLNEGIEMINSFYQLDKSLKTAGITSLSKYQSLTSYDKSMESITASSTGYYLKNSALRTKVLNDVRHLFDDLDMIRNAGGSEAEEGKAGFIGYDQEKRYVNEYGIETGAVLQKVLMGLALLDQISNDQLSNNVLDNSKLQNDNSNGVLVSGKKYTELEHHWDLAYSYLGKENFTQTPLFISNYMEKETIDMPFLKDIDKRVYKAFYLGRKAAVEKNYTEMKAQANVIKKELNTLFAARAIYYLKKGIPDLRENVKNAFHGLSEAYGFIYALNACRDTNGKQYVSYDEINQMLSDLKGERGFWDVDRLAADESTTGSLLNVSKRIADKFGFNVNDI